MAELFNSLLQKATALHDARKFGEAAAAYRDLLRLEPDNVLVMHLLALVAMQFDNAAMVLTLSDQGLALRPDFAVLHQDRATALRRLGRKEEAQAAIERALTLDPKQADFYDTLSAIQRDLRRYNQAVTSLKTAIAMEPDNAKFYNNLGICLGRMGANEEALAYLNRYITMRPTMAEGYNNRANILKTLGRYQDAIDDYNRALTINPDIFMGKANKGICHLVLGNYTEGWSLFEDRKPGNLPPEAKRFDPAQRWHGEALPDKTLILYNEQGLGDTIQFCRYIPFVKERVGRLILQIQPPLINWLKAHWPELSFITPDDPLPAHEAQCPLMSLPHIFKTQLNTVPFPGGYLKADKGKTAFWKTRLPQDGKKRIGLVWAGNPDHMNDHIRSVGIAQLAPLWQVPHVHFISLQKGERPLAQLLALPSSVSMMPLGHELNDFSDTAALLKNIDLLISVDTAVLHAAGALGVPAWAMLQYDPDWRWMIGRSDTPWYEKTRLFRQKNFGGWNSVAEEISDALRQLAG